MRSRRNGSTGASQPAYSNNHLRPQEGVRNLLPPSRVRSSSLVGVAVGGEWATRGRGPPPRWRARQRPRAGSSPTWDSVATSDLFGGSTRPSCWAIARRAGDFCLGSSLAPDGACRRRQVTPARDSHVSHALQSRWLADRRSRGPDAGPVLATSTLVRMVRHMACRRPSMSGAGELKRKTMRSRACHCG